MKYFIHTCRERLWYVEDFLVPSMVKQGISLDDIEIWNDDKMEGNLPAWLASCQYVAEKYKNEKGLWHLQDDIVIGDTFKQETEKADDIIVNAWVCRRFNPKRYGMKGVVGALYHWNSFQCIYIPNRYIEGFLRWYYRQAVRDPKCLARINENRWDDWLFWCYMRRNHKADRVLNLAPNICEHIDYLLGGSIATPERTENVYGEYWNNNEIIEQLYADILAYKAEKEKAQQQAQTKPPAKRATRERQATAGKKSGNTTTTRKKAVKTENKGDKTE